MLNTDIYIQYMDFKFCTLRNAVFYDCEKCHVYDARWRLGEH